MIENTNEDLWIEKNSLVLISKSLEKTFLFGANVLILSLYIRKKWTFTLDRGMIRSDLLFVRYLNIILLHVRDLYIRCLTVIRMTWIISWKQSFLIKKKCYAYYTFIRFGNTKVFFYAIDLYTFAWLEKPIVSTKILGVRHEAPLHISKVTFVDEHKY